MLPDFARWTWLQCLAENTTGRCDNSRRKGSMTLTRYRSLVPSLAVLGLVFLSCPPARAVSYDVNLLVNGNAETGPNSATGNPVAVPGWTTSSLFTVIPYGAAGGYPLASDPG